MDGGAWCTAVHGVARSWTRLSDFTFTFHFYALEKEMATHSCSCLENPRDGGAWWAAVYGVAKSRRTWLTWLSSSSRGSCAFSSPSQGINPLTKRNTCFFPEGVFSCLHKGPGKASALKGSLRRDVKDAFRTSETTGRLEKWSLGTESLELTTKMG